jgi:hypothetical protein
VCNITVYIDPRSVSEFVEWEIQLFDISLKKIQYLPKHALSFVRNFFCPVTIYSGQQILVAGRFFVPVMLATARTCQLLWAQT